MVPARRGAGGGRHRGGAGVRLDRHRGRAPALDRQWLHAHLAGGDPRPGDLVGLRADDGAVRRNRCDHGAGASRPLTPLARGQARGGRAPVQPTARGAEIGGVGVSSADVCATILWIGVTLYAIFGGADFGAGVWDLLAGKGERADRVRGQIDRSIGPVWEANHVWLIFVLVVLWTAFPTTFSAIMTTLYIPLALAALGIVLRGSGFAFRHALPGPIQGPATRVFGVASVLTPFFMGTVVGAIASGEVPAAGDGDPTGSWTGFLPLVTGALFVLVAAYTAAVFLVRDSGAAGDEDLRDYFSHRALIVAVVAGAGAVLGVIALHQDARYVYDW